MTIVLGEDSPTLANRGRTITEIARVLENTPFVKVKEFLPRARTPIVRFRVLLAGCPELEVDLSVSTGLAVHNSRLLLQYLSLDTRAETLVRTIRAWAKELGVNDSPDRTISSYAWAIMAIHCLQRTKGPVLPVLQDSLLEKVLVGKHNVAFCDHRPGFVSDAALTPVRLFGLFAVTMVTYQWDTQIMTIADPVSDPPIQREPGVESQRPVMEVRDPFDLSHNIVAGVKQEGLLAIKLLFHATVVWWRALLHHTPADCPLGPWLFHAEAIRFVACLRF
jgi:hypothetical protein